MQVNLLRERKCSHWNMQYIVKMQGVGPEGGNSCPLVLCRQIKTLGNSRLPFKISPRSHLLKSLLGFSCSSFQAEGDSGLALSSRLQMYCDALGVFLPTTRWSLPIDGRFSESRKYIISILLPLSRPPPQAGCVRCI